MQQMQQCWVCEKRIEPTEGKVEWEKEGIKHLVCLKCIQTVIEKRKELGKSTTLLSEEAEEPFQSVRKPPKNSRLSKLPLSFEQEAGPKSETRLNLYREMVNLVVQNEKEENEDPSNNEEWVISPFEEFIEEQQDREIKQGRNPAGIFTEAWAKSRGENWAEKIAALLIEHLKYLIELNLQLFCMIFGSQGGGKSQLAIYICQLWKDIVKDLINIDCQKKFTFSDEETKEIWGLLKEWALIQQDEDPGLVGPGQKTTLIAFGNLFDQLRFTHKSWVGCAPHYKFVSGLRLVLKVRGFYRPYMKHKVRENMFTRVLVGYPVNEEKVYWLGWVVMPLCDTGEEYASYLAAKKANIEKLEASGGNVSPAENPERLLKDATTVLEYALSQGWTKKDGKIGLDNYIAEKKIAGNTQRLKMLKAKIYALLDMKEKNKQIPTYIPSQNSSQPSQNQLPQPANIPEKEKKETNDPKTLVSFKFVKTAEMEQDWLKEYVQSRTDKYTAERDVWVYIERQKTGKTFDQLAFEISQNDPSAKVSYSIVSRRFNALKEWLQGKESKIKGDLFEDWFEEYLHTLSKYSEIKHLGKKTESDFICKCHDGTIEVMSVKCYDILRESYNIPAKEFLPEIQDSLKLENKGQKVTMKIFIYLNLQTRLLEMSYNYKQPNGINVIHFARLEPSAT